MVDRKSTIPDHRGRRSLRNGAKVGIAGMDRWTVKFSTAALTAAAIVGLATPAWAGIGDLLVAPTRLVLDGRKGTELVLNNVGDEPATYRISVEFRRMTREGGLDEVTEPNSKEKAAADMIV